MMIDLALLKEHWLTGVACDENLPRHTDRTRSTCYCSIWRSDPLPTVGDAIDAWLRHLSQVAGVPQVTGRLDEHPLLMQAYLLSVETDKLPAHEDQTRLITHLGDWRARLYAHLAKHNLLKKEVGHGG